MRNRIFPQLRFSTIGQLTILLYLICEVKLCVGAPFDDLDVLTLIDPITQFEEDSEVKKVVVKSVFNVPIRNLPTTPPCPEGTRRVTETGACVSQVSGIRLDDQFLLQSFSIFNRRRPTTPTPPPRRRKTTAAPPPIAVPTYVIEEVDQNPNNLRPLNPIYSNNLRPASTTFPLITPTYVPVPVISSTIPTTSTSLPITTTQEAPNFKLASTTLSPPELSNLQGTHSSVQERATEQLKFETTRNTQEIAASESKVEPVALITPTLAAILNASSGEVQFNTNDSLVNSETESSSIETTTLSVEDFLETNETTSPAVLDIVTFKPISANPNQVDVLATVGVTGSEKVNDVVTETIPTFNMELETTVEPETVSAQVREATQIIFYDQTTSLPVVDDSMIRFPTEDLESNQGLSQMTRVEILPTSPPKIQSSLPYPIFFRQEFPYHQMSVESRNRIMFPRDG